MPKEKKITSKKIARFAKKKENGMRETVRGLEKGLLEQAAGSAAIQNKSHVTGRVVF